MTNTRKCEECGSDKVSAVGGSGVAAKKIECHVCGWRGGVWGIRSRKVVVA